MKFRGLRHSHRQPAVLYAWSLLAILEVAFLLLRIPSRTFDVSVRAVESSVFLGEDEVKEEAEHLLEPEDTVK